MSDLLGRRFFCLGDAGEAILIYSKGYSKNLIRVSLMSGNWFVHPGVTDKGNYTMFDMVRPLVTMNSGPPGPPMHMFGGPVDMYGPRPMDRPMDYDRPRNERGRGGNSVPPEEYYDNRGSRKKYSSREVTVQRSEKSDRNWKDASSSRSSSYSSYSRSRSRSRSSKSPSVSRSRSRSSFSRRKPSPSVPRRNKSPFSRVVGVPLIFYRSTLGSRSFFAHEPARAKSKEKFAAGQPPCVDSTFGSLSGQKQQIKLTLKGNTVKYHVDMDQPVPLPRARSRSRLPIPAMRREVEDVRNDCNPAPTIVHTAEVHTARASSDESSAERDAGDDSSVSGGNASNGKRRKKLKRKGTFLVRQTNSKMDDDLAATSQATTEGRRPSTGLVSSKASSVESMKIPMDDSPSSTTPKPSSQIKGFGSEKKPGTNTSSVESVKEVRPGQSNATDLTRQRWHNATMVCDFHRQTISKYRPSQRDEARPPKRCYATETLSEDSSKANSPARVSSAPMPKPRQTVSVPKREAASTENVRRPQEPPHMPTVTPRNSNNLPNASPEAKIETILSRMGSQELSEHLKSPEILEVPPHEEIPEIMGETSQTTPSKGRLSQLGSAEKPPDSPMYYTSSSVDYKDTGVNPPTRLVLSY
ncbi:unnamed protein product [Nesidiocoris tenuis]|uniref:Uncharacterized protein n=1 Tax=Nesidiocoris tenuis TaxID=355587 RepID=A0A6H5GMK6_9HEMI|nr:unnamed protein product [Nesidiocoris tenuis]